jgi:sialidase-1
MARFSRLRIAGSAAIAAVVATLVLVLVAMRSLWEDVDRRAASWTGADLPVAITLTTIAAIVAAFYAVRSVRLATQSALVPPVRRATRVGDLVVLVSASALLVVLVTSASEAVLVAELGYWWERGPGRLFADRPAPRAPADPGERFDDRILFDGDGDPRYVTFRIPGVVVTPRGVVLAYCEAREGYGDWADIDVLMQRSSDAGESWEARAVLAENDRGTVNNPVMIAENDSEKVHLLYNVDYARAWYRRSSDAGLHWSEPREITAAFEELRPRHAWRVIAFGPGHGLELSNGRLLVPVWISPGGGADGHHPQQVATVFSDDGGDTWRAGELVTAPDGPSHGEPVAVELSDGRVLVNMRNEDFRLGTALRAVSTSPDGISRWTRPELDRALPDPISFGSLHRIDSRTILFANVHNALPIDWRVRWFGWRGRREPIGIRASYDDGVTWPVARILAPYEGGYVDLFTRNGVAYALYEQGWRRKNHYRTRSLRLARFDLAWVEGAGRSGVSRDR